MHHKGWSMGTCWVLSHPVHRGCRRCWTNFPITPPCCCFFFFLNGPRHGTSGLRCFRELVPSNSAKFQLDLVVPNCSKPSSTPAVAEDCHGISPFNSTCTKKTKIHEKSTVASTQTPSHHHASCFHHDRIVFSPRKIDSPGPS